MIIGLCGRTATGKKSVARILRTKGFTHISLSGLLRENLGVVERKIVRVKAQELREHEGDDVAAQWAMKKMVAGKKYVISSIRNMAEVATFEKMQGFVLIRVVAPQDVRFTRLRERGRIGDEMTYAEFCVKEKNEDLVKDEVERRSEHILTNAADEVTLRLRVCALLKDLRKKRRS